MKKWMKKMGTAAITAALIMGMGTTAFADVTRDASSSFTEATEGTVPSTGLTAFSIIKDYDSVNPTDDQPNSNSPEETFKYVITPYGVWNAGHTGTGASWTEITTANMPMLSVTTDTTTDTDNKIEASLSTDQRTLTVTQTVAVGIASYETTEDTENTTDKKFTVTLPTYATVGDYWYQVVEFDSETNKTAGVIYGTNDAQTEAVASANNGHDAVYYIHVQVTESDQTVDGVTTSALVANVTMHKTAPESSVHTDALYKTWSQGEGSTQYTAGAKVNAIENKYYAGDLHLRKEVTGNAGDKDAYYEVTVVFTKATGTTVNSDITYSAYASDGAANLTDYTIKGEYAADDAWTADGTNTVTFFVKDDTTVIFSNIPYGVSYEITETDYSAEGYTHTFAYESGQNISAGNFDGIATAADAVVAEGGTWANAKATGSISDAEDVIVLTNNKDVTIDIGVITSNAPFVAILIVAAGALVIIMRRRKIMIEE